MPFLTLEQILVAVRYLLAAGAPYLSTYFPAGSYEQFGLLVVALVTFAYAIWKNRAAGLAARAAESPGVIKVVAERDLARAAPSDKVVGPAGG